MVESSQSNIKLDKLPGRARFRKIVAEEYKPLVDMKEIEEQNRLRKERQENERRDKDQKTADYLYQESVKLQDSLMPIIREKILKAVTEQLSSNQGLASFAALGGIDSQLQDRPLSPREGNSSRLHILEKSVGPYSKSVKKRTVIDDGKATNYHFDYTGKMKYYDNQKYAPCPLLVNMVTAGFKGIKSGEGFYKYTAGSKDLVVGERFK